MNEEQYAQIRAELASNDTEHKSFKRRLDDHDAALKKQGDILLLLERQSNAIERMGRSIDRLEKTVEGVSNRVGTLEKEPADKWKKVTWEVVKYLLLAALGLLVGLIVKSPAA